VLRYPGRRVQGAPGTPSRTRPRPRSSPTSIEWLGELVRQGRPPACWTEWEQAGANPSRRPWSARPRRGPPAVTPQRPARSGCWSATRCSAGSSWPRFGRYDELGQLDSGDGWDAEAWEGPQSSRTSDVHDEIGTGPDARGAPPLLHHRRRPRRPWTLRQIFDGPGRGSRLGHLRAGRPGRLPKRAGQAVLRVTDVGQL